MAERKFLKNTIYFKLCSIIFLLSFFNMCKADEIIGNLRVQVLSPTLVRFELKGPGGFEDRPTFHITRRIKEDVKVNRFRKADYEILETKFFTIKIPTQAESLEGIVITDSNNKTLWSMPSLSKGQRLPESLTTNRRWLPGPEEKPTAWVIADTPRYVPASPQLEWGGGYNIAPVGIKHNGWDLKNDSPDIYVFLPKGDLARLRKDFTALTGNTGLIPLYAFGSWDSRYYPYTQSEALQKIDTYRAKEIPLDVFVVDTDWRVGASHGYGVNTRLFPDMAKFIRDAHDKNVRIVFNDHPEPQGEALGHKEVKYRNDGLRGKFKIGLDVWWYDRNWHTAIRPPKGINKEVFGMYIYDWITRDFYPGRRPLIMGNFDGIDHGHINRAPNIAAHRYAIQWTGDTTSDITSFRREIRNAVRTGVYTPFAYLSTDVGGHMGTPTTEQYCRWVQFGAMSAIFRLHCGRDDTRDPWKYQDPAEDVTRDYLQMRMRLLPVFYYAARENYETGMPILKRCDLNYPGYCQAKSDYQYLLGDDILVAPIMGTIVSTVNADWLNKGNGLKGEYFSGRSFSGTPEVIRTDPVIDFDWSDKPPAENISKDNFCVRWTGNISCKAGSDIKIGLEADDGCRLWIDDELVIDQWVDQAKTTVWAEKVYKDQKTYKIKIEYYEAAFQACCRLLYKKSGGQTFSERQLWIPPGSWIDVWNGKKVKGPANYKKLVSIKQMPIFVKEGSIIPLAPNMAHTGQKAWDPVTLDYYPGNSGISKAQIYEDDGLSNQYRNNRFRKTHFQAKIDDKRKKITLVINPSAGTFKKALKKRSWIVRMRSPQGWPERPSQVQVDGKIVSCKIVAKKSHAMPFAVSGAGPDCDIIEIAVPCDSILKKRNIVVSFGLL